ncbi:MAG: heavy metal-associated domain protein [Oscillospiraceae bacterium]|nr:heavy metal-associated domain protein [Oscillospiraceae bacterium]
MSKASVYFSVKNPVGKHGTKELKRELDALNGVLSVSVNNRADNIAVDFDTTGVKQEQIKTQLEILGYDITQMRVEDHIM